MKTILLFLIVTMGLFSSDTYELKLYEKVLPAIFKTKPLNIYTDNQSKKIFYKSDTFTIVNSCREATVLIGDRFISLPQYCQYKPIFYTNYRNYKKDKNGFGVFYWRKGRPQIKFKRSSLDYLHLKLPLSLQRYEE